MQSDQRLSDLYRRGVDPAFDELVERYRASLTAFAGAIVGSARAEDVVQDSLVKAHRAMAAEEVGEPRAWLYRVVRNTALNEIRDGKKHEHAELSGAEPAGLTPEREVEGRQEFEALVAALGELPEAQRQAIVDRELGGYTHDEIARELGVTTGATKQLIFRARTGLRNAFGALIPAPLIIWLAQELTGAFAAASSAGAVAGVTASAGAAGGTGGAAAGAGAGGILGGLVGGGAAKVAAVAVVATGTVAAGVAVEQRVVNDGPESRPAIEAVAAGSSEGIEFTEDGTPALVPDPASSGKVDGSNRGADGRGGSSQATDRVDQDRPGDPGDVAEGEDIEPGENPARPVGERPGGPSGTSGRPGGGPGSPGGGGRPPTGNGGHGGSGGSGGGRPLGDPGPGPGNSGGGGPGTNPGNSGGQGAGQGGSGGGSGNPGGGGRPSGGGPATGPGNSGGSGGGRPSGGPPAPDGGRPSGPASSRPGS